MADDIPPDFDRPWGNSNVVLETLNSDGKELHANKAVLSVFSPYFNALFSGRFAENNITSVKMECNYNAMKEVLRNIHQIGFSYKPNGLMQYNLEMLRALYTIGDFYNFPHIRKLCLDQMPERPSVGMAIVAADFGLRDIVMEILIRLEIREVRRFLSNKNVKHLFTKNEFLRIFEKATGEPIPKYPPSLKKLSTLSPKPLNLEEITVEIANPRIDLTKPWEMADLSISAKNSLGRLLYSNTTAMNLVSNKFKNLQFTPIILDGKELSSTTVDAEYTTIKEILIIIHHCDTNYKSPVRVLHPALLHSMYHLASEDQLDIPMIRDLCVARLMKQNTIDSLVVLQDLNFQELNISNIDLSIDDWCDWIYGDHESLSYRKGEDVVVVAPSRDEPHLTNWATLWLIDKLSPLVMLPEE